MQNLKHTFYALFLCLVFGLSKLQAANPFDPLVKAASTKLKKRIALNHQNDLAGKSHLNQYIVYITAQDLITEDKPWFTDQSQVLSPSQTTQLNQMAQAGFVKQPGSSQAIPEALQDTRFYIVYIKDVPIQLPPNSKLEQAFTYAHLQQIHPELENSFRVPLADALETLAQEYQKESTTFAEQAFLSVGSILVEYADGQTERSFFDYLDTQGEQLSQSTAYQYIQQRLPTEENQDIYTNLSGIVQSFNKSIKAIRLGEADLQQSPQPDVNTDDLDQKTAENRYLYWERDLADIASQTHQPGHIHLQGFKIPYQQKQAINEKLAFLQAEAGINVQIIYFRLSYTLPKDQHQAFLDEVWTHRELHKNEKTILVVVPIYVESKQSLLALTRDDAIQNLYSFPGIRGSEAYASALKELNNAFLSAPVNDLTARALALYKALPKPYTRYSYYMNYKGDIIELAPQYNSEVTGKALMHEMVLLEDARTETYISNFKHLYFSPILQNKRHFFKLGRSLESIFQLCQPSLSPEEASYFGKLMQIEKTDAQAFVQIQHGLKETALAKDATLGKNYVAWYRKDRFSALSEVYQFVPLSRSEAPSLADDVFEGGINKVIYDRNIEFLDALSLMLSPTGLDVVVDVSGVVYASYYGDISTAAGFSIGAIPLVGTANSALKPLIKGTKQALADLKAQKFVIKSWSEVIEQIFTAARQTAVAELSLEGIQDLGQIALRKNDGVIDVLVHYQEGKYWVYLENRRGRFEKSLQALDEAELGEYLLNQLPNKRTDLIRLLSCSDLTSAQKLSQYLEGRKVIASDDVVTVYADGTVEGGKWYEIEGTQQREVDNLSPPKEGTDKSKYVVMGAEAAIAKYEKFIYDNLLNKRGLELDDVINLKSIKNIAYVQVLANTLTDLVSKYGVKLDGIVAAPEKTFQGKFDDDIMAILNFEVPDLDKILIINSDFFNKFQNITQLNNYILSRSRNVNNINNVAKSINEVIIHEYGHLLTNPKNKDAYIKFKNNLTQKDQFNLPKLYVKNQDQISFYATKNGIEALAEIFTRYETGMSVTKEWADFFNKYKLYNVNGISAQ